MTYVAADAVRSFVLERVADPLRAKDLTPEQVPDDFDLLTEGVIDSLGVLEMVSEVEQHFGLEVDFEELDAADMTRVGPFSRYVADKSNGASEQP